MAFWLSRRARHGWSWADLSRRSGQPVWRGGRTAAILMSLLVTAQAAGIHVGDYFRDVLVRISTCTDVKKLTPHGWQEHYAAEVTERRHALLRQIAGER